MHDYSPMWREVLQHAHWTPELTALGVSALRQTFGLAPGASIPPFIVLHARHGDFANYCRGSTAAECFAPLSAFAMRVREIQDELHARTGVRPAHVLMTSDERDAAWWADVAALGWFRLELSQGSKEAEALGDWYPVVMDAVVQSMGVGFVGTEESTFSHIARRRVMDWNGGITRMVKWGRPGADDH